MFVILKYEINLDLEKKRMVAELAKVKKEKKDIQYLEIFEDTHETEPAMETKHCSTNSLDKISMAFFNMFEKL